MNCVLMSRSSSDAWAWFDIDSALRSCGFSPSWKPAVAGSDPGLDRCPTHSRFSDGPNGHAFPEGSIRERRGKSVYLNQNVESRLNPKDRSRLEARNHRFTNALPTG